MKIRRHDERGHANHGWLDSFHTFSFANYFDPSQMGFGSLRVINEDRVAAGQGFGKHSHSDMEILSYVLDGSLEHKDSMGTGSVMVPGDVQRMSAGTGVAHSEFNASKSEEVHFLQIWIVPDKKGYQPGYEQKPFSVEQRKNKLCLVASNDGRDGSLTIHQKVDLHASLLDKGAALDFELPASHKAWVHLARGTATVNGETLTAGDAAAIVEPGTIHVVGGDDTELLLFDLAS